MPAVRREQFMSQRRDYGLAPEKPSGRGVPEELVSLAVQYADHLTTPDNKELEVLRFNV